jgi:hypothetical protein
MGLRLCLSPRALGSGPSALGRCPGVSGCPGSSAGDHIHAAPFGERPAARFDPDNGRTPAVSQGIVLRTPGLAPNASGHRSAVGTHSHSRCTGVSQGPVNGPRGGLETRCLEHESSSTLEHRRRSRALDGSRSSALVARQTVGSSSGDRLVSADGMFPSPPRPRRLLGIHLAATSVTHAWVRRQRSWHPWSAARWRRSA